MKKGKSITLLTIICVLMAVLAFFTFAQFESGLKKYNGVLGAIQTEYDISGGTAYTLTLARDNIKEIDDIEKVKSTISLRMNALGYEVFNITAYKSFDKDVKDYQIRIETKALPGENGTLDTSRLGNDVAVAVAFGELKFYGGTTANPTEEIFIGKNPIESAQYIGVGTGTSNNAVYQVQITFKESAFSELEGNLSSNYYMSIKLGDTTLLDGNNALSKDYFINRSIVLSTSNEATARQTALQIQYGAIDYKYEITSVDQIDSVYGFNAILACEIAVIALFVLSTAYFLIKYRGLGIVSALTFIIFICVYLWMLILVPNVRVSMGGLIAMIFASILTIDGFVIIFKRIAEENAMKKTAKFSIIAGQQKALKPIISAGLFSGVIALSLFILSTGILKQFAIILGIGTVLSVISTLLLVRMFISLFYKIAKNKESFFNMVKAEDIENEKDGE